MIGAFALGFLALLSFGGFSFFSKPQRFLVFFNESVHGLDLGSAVKLRGVRVGRVVDLTLRYDEASRRSMVAVLCAVLKVCANCSHGPKSGSFDQIFRSSQTCWSKPWLCRCAGRS